MTEQPPRATLSPMKAVISHDYIPHVGWRAVAVVNGETWMEGPLSSNLGASAMGLAQQLLDALIRDEYTGTSYDV